MQYMSYVYKQKIIDQSANYSFHSKPIIGLVYLPVAVPKNNPYQ